MTEFSRLHSKHHQRRLSLFKLFLYVLIGGVAIYLVKTRFSPSPDASLSQTNNVVSSANAPIKSKVTYPKNSPNLEKVVKKSLEVTKGTYGIVIKNLKTNETYVQNEHRIFEPGSIYKLWIMAIIFEKLQQGSLKTDDPAIADVAELNKKYLIPDEEAEFNEGTMNFTVQSALEQMITISHNYASLALTEKIGLEAVEKFLTDNEFSESKVGYSGKPPLTTPSDVVQFFDKLYHGKLADQKHTEEMLALLKRTQNNNLLPKYLPEEIEVGHKIGRIDNFDHDAGIVFSPKGDYIIVVMSETDSPDLAEERIALLSKNVYEYFSNK